MRLKYIATAMMSVLMCTNTFAQSKLTKEQIMTMSIDELSELPLEDLMEAVETLGVSSVDELFAMIMNKNVSSASKTEENSFTSPLSTTVITRAEMRTYGISTIEEAFRLIPGMIVTEKTNGIYDIQMRGLNNIPDNNMLLYSENANTLLMVDNRPVQNYAMGALTMDMLQISIEDVERIEVVRGACSALYGANAVTGVINIITEKPGESSNLVSGSIQMGTKETVVGDIAIRNAWKNGKIAAGLTMNMQNRGRGTDKLYVMAQNDLYRANTPEAQANRYSQVQIADINAFEAEGNYTNVSKGGWMTVDEVNNLRFVRRTAMPTPIPTYLIMNATEPQTPVNEMFNNISKARKNFGFNGYLSFVPNSDVRIDLQAGYQTSDVISTPMGDDVFSLNNRISKGGYVNLNAGIHGLSLNASYDFGPQNYSNGVPGFKVGHNSLNASAEYDIDINDFHIKPGIAAQWVKYNDYLPVYNSENPKQSGDYTWYYVKDGKPGDSKNRLYGFFDTEAKITNIAPSVRVDYKVGDFRFSGAFRSDKTSIPDKWNHSWQASANYKINENNFIRFVYGRANRGATMVNSSANYQWVRTYMTPEKMVFVGNEDADLVHADSYELGYRWKPISNILIDAELFMSHSEDYGALMANRTMHVVDAPMLQAIMGNALGQFNAILNAPSPEAQQGLLQGLIAQSSGMTAGSATTRTYVQYNNLPYKVNQYGFSINMDWIISPKLIAKINANAQQTRIDDYYQYSQTQEIAMQVGNATASFTNNLVSGRLFGDIMQTVAVASQGDVNKAQQLLATITGHSLVENYMNNIGWSNMNEAQQEALLNQLKATGLKGETMDGVENPLNMYYAIKYNVLRSMETDEFFIGSTTALKKDQINGHKHKATPSIYGMIGLIYKPMQRMTVSAFGNFLGKRTMDTTYGSTELKNHFTVNMKIGYKPVDNVELFANAHNLFNNQKNEFVFTDKVGGVYTFGVNFGF
ncbi:MAG: TonB-dependent receptor [Bacteroidales bacterium]|nr:TonB-dependent receptor [Bacteroidales bacterium]